MNICMPEESRRAPRWSATALELSSLCAELLQLDALEPSDQLFARGLNSISCVSLVAQARERLGVTLELRDVFEAPRIFELAERVDALRAAQRSDYQPIEGASRAYALPLSAAQLHVWLASRTAQSGPVQHVAGGLRVRGPLDRAALLRAAEQLALRHESLRTTIEEQAGVPVQRVFSALPIELRVVEVEPGQDSASCVRATAERAFDLASGPLWRLWLFPIAQGDQLVVLCMHQVIADGWSLELARRELLQLYAAELGLSEAAELPALPLQFSDYCAWEAEVLDTDERIGQQLDYWRAQLQGRDERPLLLPQRRAPEQRASAARTVAFDLDPILSAHLRALSVELNTGLFPLLLAAFQLWLGRMTGRTDVCVGVPALGRQRIEAVGLIGCFVNTLVMRQRIVTEASVAELVRCVDASVRAALAHAELPLDTLARALASEETPLFQVTYNHLRVSASSENVAGLRIECLPRAPLGSPCELSLETEEHADGQLRVLFVYAAEVFERESVCQFAKLFEHLLWQMARSSERRLSELELRGSTE